MHRTISRNYPKDTHETSTKGDSPKDDFTFTKHQAYQNDKDLITAIKGGQVRTHFPTRKTNRESECFEGEA